MNTEALLLAGGLGTRLRSILPETPKTLADVGGRPFITYILDQLIEAGIQSVVICTGYRADQVRASVGQKYEDLCIRYSQEPYPMGTAGAVKYAVNTGAVFEEDLLVLNADSYIHADLRVFQRVHDENNRVCSLLLAHVLDTGRFGTVRFNEYFQIQEFIEKTGIDAPGWINAGVYIIPRRWISELTNQLPLSLERNVLPHWVGYGMYGHCVHAPFIDIGTPNSLAYATSFFDTLPTNAEYE